jgi:hypothetical protein
VLRRIFGPKKVEEKYIMRNFITCALPNIIRKIKSRGIKIERHVECMGGKTNA